MENTKTEKEWVYKETALEKNYFDQKIELYKDDPKSILHLGMTYRDYLLSRYVMITYFGDEFTDEKIKFYEWSEVGGFLAAVFGVLAKYDGKTFWKIQTGVS